MMLWLGFRRLCNWHAVWHQTGFFSLSKPQFPHLQNKRFFLGGRKTKMPSMKTLVGSYQQHYLVEFFITSNFQVGKLKLRDIRWVSKVTQQEVYDVRSKLWSSWIQAYSCLFGRSTVSLSPKLQSCPILSHFYLLLSWQWNAVLVSYRCCNKWRQIGGLQQHQCIIIGGQKHDMDLSGIKLSCCQGWLLLEPPGISQLLKVACIPWLVAHPASSKPAMALKSFSHCMTPTPTVLAPSSLFKDS